LLVEEDLREVLIDIDVRRVIPDPNDNRSIDLEFDSLQEFLKLLSFETIMVKNRNLVFRYSKLTRRDK